MYKHIKRLLDFVFSLLLILVLSPFFILTPLAIWLSMGRPAIFSQKRIGLINKVFRIYKYRSMVDKSKKNKTDHQRITWLGKFLRVTRIDEFPQLYNILKGDMSFIGPRPLLPEYLPFYTERELRRHEVRPGLSGLSQVSGSYPDWEEQFELDIQYVDNISFLLDVKLFFITFIKVLLPTKKLVSGKAGRPRFDLYRQQKNSQLKNS